MKVIALIPAAGMGKRMGGGINKQYLLLREKPILAHTLGVFERAPFVDDIFVITPEQEIPFCREQVVERYGFTKVRDVVAGGSERQYSVLNGLRAVAGAADEDVVLIHDGVRPFVTPELVCRVIQAARSRGAAVLGLPAQDTLKTVNSGGEIRQTLERKDIWQIQTPQAFQAPLLRRAFTEAYSRNFYGTDEASLVEQLNHPVVVIPGSPLNLKITTPDDLDLAEAILPLSIALTLG